MCWPSRSARCTNATSNAHKEGNAVNLIEFNALKVGDKIENAMSNSSGEVTEVNQGIVKVRWVTAPIPNRVTELSPRTYSVHSTIWFHWSKAEDAAQPDDTAQASAPTT